MAEEAQTTQLIYIDHREDQKQQNAATTQMKTSTLHVSMVEASLLHEPSKLYFDTASHLHPHQNTAIGRICRGEASSNERSKGTS